MKQDKEIQKTMDENSDMRIYEVGFHVVPTIPEEKVIDALDEVKSNIEGLDGVVLTDYIKTEVINLAYAMDSIVGNKKSIFDTSYFGWIKFEIIPENIIAVESALKKNKDIFRFLIIKTVRENTFETSQPIIEKKITGSREKKVEVNEKQKKELSNVEVDKAIEDLVVE